MRWTALRWACYQCGGSFIVNIQCFVQSQQVCECGLSVLEPRYSGFRPLITHFYLSWLVLRNRDETTCLASWLRLPFSCCCADLCQFNQTLSVIMWWWLCGMTLSFIQSTYFMFPKKYSLLRMKFQLSCVFSFTFCVPYWYCDGVGWRGGKRSGGLFQGAVWILAWRLEWNDGRYQVADVTVSVTFSARILVMQHFAFCKLRCFVLTTEVECIMNPQP